MAGGLWHGAYCLAASPILDKPSKITGQGGEEEVGERQEPWKNGKKERKKIVIEQNKNEKMLENHKPFIIDNKRL